MAKTSVLLGRRGSTLHHLPKPLRDRGRAWVARKVKQLEAWGTDPWAAARLFDVETFTPAILEPGVGTGVLAQAAAARAYHVRTWDIFDWGWPGVELRDFRDAARTDVWSRSPHWPANATEFSVVCNPPFTMTAAFVAKALELGARKVAAFAKMEFMGSLTRRPWLDANPPARIWMCGTRATCWRFDVPPERRKGSTPTLHAWFVWERGHGPGPGGAPLIRCIWEN